MFNASISRPIAGLGLLALAFIAGSPASAEDAMKASPMQSGAMMKTGAMAIGGMSAVKTKKDCLAKAEAETDAGRKIDMTTACNAMAASPMQSGALTAKK